MPSLDENKEAFDRLLPELPAQIATTPKRITITRASGPVVICLARPNRYHEAIFTALAEAIKTPWFTSLSSRSQKVYFTNLKQLFEWINESGYTATEINCFECLKEFEAYRANVAEAKRSPLCSIPTMLRKGLDGKDLSDEDYLYLRTLLRLSKPSKQPEPKPHTLTEWFSLPWLRSLVGEKQYLSLESPSRLISSFRVTISITLSYLLEIRAQWKKQVSMSCVSDSNKDWYRKWGSQLLKCAGTFDKAGEPADELTQLLCLDLISQNQWPIVKEQIAKNGIEKVRLFGKNLTSTHVWKCPVFFHPDNQHNYSKVEELLMAWLVACETIQPWDIATLKTNDYACEYNRSGRLIAMQCCYYKGRSGLNREPAVLIASDCWTKAQYAYLKGLPLSARLFRHSIGRALKVPEFAFGSRIISSPLNMIWRLWQTPRLQTRIREALKRAGALPIFLESALALTRGSESHDRFVRRNPGASRSKYEAVVPRPLPGEIFSLSHIKTTAVHAGSDQYRDGDLINHHSHTSATEKHHYLSDANKDFVNRAGRITRLVLYDLQNVVYQPSVSALTQAVNDLELRSRVTEATGLEDAQVHQLNFPTDRPKEDDMILIPDTIEQALIFTHSITQAEERYRQLLNLRPDWVERTLLPQLEWMSRTLAKMRSAAAAQQEYADLKHHLPPVFDHLLETHE